MYVYFPFPASVHVPFSTFAVVRSGTVTAVPLLPFTEKLIVSRLFRAVPLIVLLTIRLPTFSTSLYAFVSSTVTDSPALIAADSFSVVLLSESRT